MTLIVHGGSPSPFVRKVRVALFEKGIAHESRDLIPIPKTPELLAMNPLGKIPILEEGDLRLPDSSVICAYVERIHPEPALYPSDPTEFGHALFLEEYSDTRLSDAISPVFFETVVKPRFFSQEPDAARVKQALENDVPPAFDYLESRLGDGATVLSELSIADVALGTQLQGFRMAEREIDSSRWPKLARYAASLHARPSFEKALA